MKYFWIKTNKDKFNNQNFVVGIHHSGLAHMQHVLQKVDLLWYIVYLNLGTFVVLPCRSILQDIDEDDCQRN